MMKSDVMNDFVSINICTGYQVSGEIVQDLTYETLSKPVDPLYEVLQGWQMPTDGICDFALLPQKLQQYTAYIEEIVGLPIKILSSGPGREETIQR